jgi:ABC-2 type transport system ATP-binding protein
MTAPNRPATRVPGGTDVLARAVDVRRTFDAAVALDGVSLDVPAGQLIGLLGPNGAGKSTLISLMLGLRRPTSGTVELFGGDPRDAVNRRLIGNTPQETGLPPLLRVREVVDFVAGHYDGAVPTGELLERFGLQDLARRQTGGLSGGQKRRLAVALAFVGRPRLVFLDEPTTGLDVDARHALWQAIRDFHADGGTVVLTSHYLEEVQALAERVVVIDRGRVLADDTLDAVRAVVDVRRVSLRTDDASVLADLPGVSSVAQGKGGRSELLTSDSDAVVREMVRRAVPFSDLEVSPTSLEEAFLSLTRNAGPSGSDDHLEVAR